MVKKSLPVKVLYIRCGDYGIEPLLTVNYDEESLKDAAQRFINTLIKKKKEVKKPMEIFLADASDTLMGFAPKKYEFGINMSGGISMNLLQTS